MKKQRLLVLSVVVVSLVVLCLQAPATAQDVEYPTTNVSWTRLTTGANSPDDGWPAWSPDGTRIAWGVNRHIWEMDAHDGGNKAQVTSGNDERHPAYSPDGQKLAYSRVGPSGQYIVVKDLNTMAEMEVYNGGYTGGPTWSPDGSEIAFSAGASLNEDHHIYTVNADGTNLTQLTFEQWMNDTPDWSPDGSRILFTSDRAGSVRNQVGHLYVMDADGSNVVQLTDGTFSDGVAVWSPDGTFIAVARGVTHGVPGHIYVMKSDGTNAVQITDSSEGEGLPDWSPDRSKLAFAATVGGNRDIYTVDIDLDAIYGSKLVASTDSPKVYPGDVLSIDLAIQGADGLYAAQAGCGVDPAVLEMQSAVFGDFFDPVDRLVAANEVSPTLGTWFGAISQQNPAGPLDGDGLYATLTLEATGVGTTTITCGPLFSDRDGFTQTVSYIAATITVLPYATITGTATYQGRLTHAGIEVVATGPVIQTDTTNSSGGFTLGQLRTGTYTVTADVGSYLPNCTTVTLVAGDEVTLPSARLLGGDLNDDDVINIGDATLLTANFNETVPPGDARTDINADGIVNVQDLAILAGNYEVSGCQGW